MDSKKKFIVEKDYERYTVHLPWSIILKGKTNKYIYNELEKKHPCFSDEWCFERKSSLKKNGVESDVVVMNKFTLAEYKQRFPGKRLYLENFEKRDFASKEYVRLYVLVGLFLILLWALVGIRFAISKNKIVVVEESAEVSQITEKRTDLVMKFLDFVEKNNGRFSSLNWICDGSTEVFTAEVSLLFPEQILELSTGNEIEISNVQYKDGLPRFSITIKDKVKDDKNEGKGLQNNTNRALIRQIFTDFNIQLEEEKSKQLGFRFTCPHYKEIDGEGFLSEVVSFCKNTHIGISRLELLRIENKNGADGFSGQIFFDENMSFGKGINPEALAWRMNLIVEKNRKQIEAFSPAKVRSSRPITTTKGTYIGEILRSDGVRVRFYKNSQGKILKEEGGL